MGPKAKRDEQTCRLEYKHEKLIERAGGSVITYVIQHCGGYVGYTHRAGQV
jgi:hypothetical protein